MFNKGDEVKVIDAGVFDRVTIGEKAIVIGLPTAENDNRYKLLFEKSETDIFTQIVSEKYAHKYIEKI